MGISVCDIGGLEGGVEYLDYLVVGNLVEAAVEQYGALSDCRNVLLVNAELRRFHHYSYFAHP